MGRCSSASAAPVTTMPQQRTQAWAPTESERASGSVGPRRTPRINSQANPRRTSSRCAAMPCIRQVGGQGQRRVQADTAQAMSARSRRERASVGEGAAEPVSPTTGACAGPQEAVTLRYGRQRNWQAELSSAQPACSSSARRCAGRARQRDQRDPCDRAPPTHAAHSCCSQLTMAPKVSPCRGRVMLCMRSTPANWTARRSTAGVRPMAWG